MVIDNRNRIFHYAVLASLALHALLLFAFPDLVDTARRAASIPPQIIARLMELEPPAAPPATVEPPQREVPPPVPQKKAAKPAPPAETPLAPKPPPVLSAPQPAPQPVPAAPAAAPPEPPSAPPVAAVEPQPAAPAQSAPQPSAPPQPAQAAEALSQDQYRLLLVDAARRIRKQLPYPPAARDNNWVGQVPLRVQVGANGQAAVTLRGSSGYQELDRHGLQLFSRAAREVPVPPALRGREFVVEVRAIYDLTE